MLPGKMYSSINSIEARPDPDKPQPQLTAGMVPLADKLLETLEAHNQDVARTCAEQLATQVHAQYGAYLRKQNDSASSGDPFFDHYLKISVELRSDLRRRDIKSAATVALDVQKRPKTNWTPKAGASP